MGELYERVLIGRIRTRSDDVLGEEQCVFRSVRGYIDQLFVMIQLREKFWAKVKDLFMAFMDLEKTYDRLDRDALWQVLRLYGVGGKLLKAVQSFEVDSTACIRIEINVRE